MTFTRSELHSRGQEQGPPDGRRITGGPSGLGGWLLPHIIGLFLTPIVTVFTLFRYALPTLEAANWSRFTDPSYVSYVKLAINSPQYGFSGFIDAWSPYFTFETFVTVAWIAVPILLLVLLLQKKRAFPEWMIWCILTALLVRLIEMAAMTSFGADAFLRGGFPQTAQWVRTSSIAAFAVALVGAAIWIPYFLSSRRVKNTFVR